MRSATSEINVQHERHEPPRHEHKAIQLRLDATGNVVAPRSAREHSYDRVVMTDIWARIPYPLAALCEAGRLLREKGRLRIVERHRSISIRELVRLLANNGWEIHNCEETEGGGYTLEAALSDESVTS